MRILQISPRLPYPLFDGGVISVFKVAESTSALGHTVTFVTYPDDDPAVTDKARKVYKDIVRMELVSKPLPSMMSTLIRTIFKGAYPIERRMMPEMFTLLEKLLAEEQYDIVHVDHAHMGKYALWIKEKYNIPVVLREHNYEAKLYERYAANERNPLKKIVASIHGRRLRKEEARFIQGVDATIPITKEDEALMKRDSPNAIYYTIPAGVDTEYYKPSSEPETPNSILWVGGVNWLPNRDAFEFFMKDIFPKIVTAVPDVVFDVVGDNTNILGDIISAEFSKSVRLHGRVPDIRPFVAKTNVLICPLRVGGGMRLKLLDFFSSGKAVVSTSIGAEGNLAKDGEHILIRDDAAGFADGVISLLDDGVLRAKLGANARELVDLKYSWQSIGKRFCDVYEKVIATHKENTTISTH